MPPRNDAAPVVVWFRQDLRLTDNPALTAASATGRPVIPVYILEDAPGLRKMGAASRWWLHHSLTALAKALEKEYRLPLLLRRGAAHDVLREIIRDSGADTVFWNRRYEPGAVAADTRLKTVLKESGLHAESFKAALLHEPWEMQTQGGGYYKVFTPFWRACRQASDTGVPLSRPKRLMPPPSLPGSETLDGWALLPTRPDWAGGIRQAWAPGEDGARAMLAAFLANGLKGYATLRDRPALRATSRLSPHLHFGEISPRQIAAAVAMHADANPECVSDAEKFLSEIGWREFSHHLLHHFPGLPETNFRSEFNAFPWQAKNASLRAWQKGRTGYPIVDAGMRELWTTGWMHNRVRMIVASFLVKHLRQHWREGESWFWDTLVDADLANNAASWQWVAGSGADAAPYFRVFNPILQGERFDPDGVYVRRWLPELARLPDAYIHKPWTAPAEILQAAGITLGDTYPSPIVDHDTARQAALAAFASLREDTPVLTETRGRRVKTR